MVMALLVMPIVFSITWSEDTQTNFRIVPPPEPVCYHDEYGSSFWVTGDSIDDSIEDCHRDVVDYGTRDCCPLDLPYECVDQGGSSSCAYGLRTGCSSFDTQESCNAQNETSIAIWDVERQSDYGTGFCTDPYSRHINTGTYAGCDEKVVNCRCEWDNTSGLEFPCAPKNDYARFDCPGAIGPIITCTKPTLGSQIVGNFLTIRWDGYFEYISAGGAVTCTSNADCTSKITSVLEASNLSCNSGKCISNNCKGGKKNFPWGEKELAWFGTLQFVLTLSLVFLFYFSKRRFLNK